MNSADRITVYINDVAIVDDEGKEITIQDIGAGDKVQIHYDGRIAKAIQHRSTGVIKLYWLNRYIRKGAFVCVEGFCWIPR